MKQIIKCLLEMREVFGKADIEPPTIITMPNEQAGNRLYAELRTDTDIERTMPQLWQNPHPAYTTEGNTTYAEIEVVGIRIRWPAKPIVRYEYPPYF